MPTAAHAAYYTCCAARTAKTNLAQMAPWHHSAQTSAYAAEVKSLAATMQLRSLFFQQLQARVIEQPPDKLLPCDAVTLLLFSYWGYCSWCRCGCCCCCHPCCCCRQTSCAHYCLLLQPHHQCRCCCCHCCQFQPHCCCCCCRCCR